MGLFERYSNSVYTSISRQNSNRLLLTSVLVFFLHASHLLTFYIGEPGSSDPNSLAWHKGILNAHWVGFGASIIFLIVSFLILRYKSYNKWYTWGFPIIPMAFYLLFSMWVVSIDQLITTSISPYLLVCVAMAFLFIYPPHYSFIIFLLNYLIFHFTIPHVVSNPEVALSNRVNALSFNIMSFGIQWAFWLSTGKNLQQKELIDKQKEDLEKDSAFKDKLFSIIGHDLKGPISGFSAGIEMLAEEDLEEQERIELIRQLKKSANSTYSLLENLLEWSLIQRGISETKKAKLNTQTHIQKTINLLHTNAVAKGIQFESEISENIGVWFDEKAFDTLLRNLISNAIKFTPENGKIKLTVAKISTSAEIRISDSGIGMDTSQIDIILNGKIAKSRYGTSGEKGTGMGLLLCREFLLQNQSTMDIQSKPNEGTTIILNIPLAI